MSNGTMIRNRPRIREDEHDELADRRPGAFATRVATAGRALGVATALAVAVAGVFALLGPGQTVRGADPRLAAAPAADGTRAAGPQAPAAVRGAEPGELAPTFRAASVDLPPARNLTASGRRAALLAYLADGGVPVSAGPAQVVRAARNTCTALDDGTSRADFTADLARIAGYTAVQSAHFVAGATHFYCPRHSAAVGR